MLHESVAEDVAFDSVGDDDSCGPFWDANVGEASVDRPGVFGVDPVDGVCSPELAEPFVSVVNDDGFVLRCVELMDVVDLGDEEVFALFEVSFCEGGFADACFSVDDDCFAEVGDLLLGPFFEVVEAVFWFVIFSLDDVANLLDAVVVLDGGDCLLVGDFLHCAVFFDHLGDAVESETSSLSDWRPADLDPAVVFAGAIFLLAGGENFIRRCFGVGDGLLDCSFAFAVPPLRRFEDFENSGCSDHFLELDEGLEVFASGFAAEFDLPAEVVDAALIVVVFERELFLFFDLVEPAGEDPVFAGRSWSLLNGDFMSTRFLSEATVLMNTWGSTLAPWLFSPRFW